MSLPQVGAGIGIANLPNQRHKIVAKSGANFTLMVCGRCSRLPCTCISLIMQQQQPQHKLVSK